MDKTRKPIGSQWEISANNSDHEFEIGEKVTIVSHEEELWYSYDNATNGKKEYAVDDYELRPLPPPVAEERTEKMWLDIVHSVVAGYERMKMPFEVAEELKKQFHITKK